MAQKKKGDGSTVRALETQPLGLAIIPQPPQTYDDENVEVEDVIYGELEVNLQGGSVEDLVAFQRIEVRLAKASQRAHEAVEAAQPSSSQMQMMSKGKERQMSDAEAEYQLKLLREEELSSQM